MFKFYACLYIRPAKDPDFARGQEREDVQLWKQEKRKPLFPPRRIASIARAMSTLILFLRDTTNPCTCHVWDMNSMNMNRSIAFRLTRIFSCVSSCAWDIVEHILSGGWRWGNDSTRPSSLEALADLCRRVFHRLARWRRVSGSVDIRTVCVAYGLT